MDAQPVDPRNITREVDYPTYRVTFWREDGSASDEWRLADAVNVHDVLEWADARLEAGWKRAGRTRCSSRRRRTEVSAHSAWSARTRRPSTVRLDSVHTCL